MPNNDTTTQKAGVGKKNAINNSNKEGNNQTANTDKVTISIFARIWILGSLS
jgi:hypothetical protein